MALLAAQPHAAMPADAKKKPAAADAPGDVHKAGSSLLSRAWKDKSSKMLRESGQTAAVSVVETGWFAACRQGDLDEMERMLDDGSIDVDHVDAEGHTGFFHACLEEQMRAARLLKSRGADAEWMDKTGTTPFWAASEAGNLVVVQFLHEQCDVASGRAITNGATPLHAACHQGHIDVVKYLVEEVGVDVAARANNGATPMFIACYNGQLPVARYLGDLQTDVHTPTHPSEKAPKGLTARMVADKFEHAEVRKFVDGIQGVPLSRPVRHCFIKYQEDHGVGKMAARSDGNCQLRTDWADVLQAALAYRHVLMTTWSAPPTAATASASPSPRPSPRARDPSRTHPLHTQPAAVACLMRWLCAQCRGATSCRSWCACSASARASGCGNPSRACSPSRPRPKARASSRTWRPAPPTSRSSARRARRATW